MPESSDGTDSSNTTVSNQLAALVPSFDPSKDDLQVYQQKIALLLEAWPSGKYTELATRLILNCVGSAFKKLQLHQAELIANDRKSIQRIIELLGGHWGQIDLEKKYEFAERALYKCMQKSDESADSYLARADIMWTELNSKKFQLSDLQAYVTLRGSMLSAEDKKSPEHPILITINMGQALLISMVFQYKILISEPLVLFFYIDLLCWV